MVDQTRRLLKHLGWTFRDACQDVINRVRGRDDEVMGTLDGRKPLSAELVAAEYQARQAGHDA